MGNRHSSPVDSSPSYDKFGSSPSSVYQLQLPEQRTPPARKPHPDDCRPHAGFVTPIHEHDSITNISDLRDSPAPRMETCMSRASLGNLSSLVTSLEPRDTLSLHNGSGSHEYADDDAELRPRSQGLSPGLAKKELCNGPSSPVDLRSILVRLPLELVWLIVDYIQDTSDDLADLGATRTFRVREARGELSRLSLVCREWSDIVRPKLFQDLELRSLDHVYFVLTMLQRQGNEWLAAAVTTIHLNIGVSHSGVGTGLERVLRLLSGKLPSLKRLRHFSSWGIADSMGPTSLTLFRRYSNLHELELTGIKVLSFSSLAHLLGMLPMLKVLKCREVYWSNRDAVERRPARIAPFLHLREVYVVRDQIDGGVAPDAFLWLYPAIRAVGDHDVVLVQLLMKQVHCMHEGNTTTTFTYSDEESQLVVEHSNRSRYTITFLSPSDALSNAVNSAICHVDIRLDASLHTFTSSETSWKALDSTFAQKADKMKSLKLLMDYKDRQDLPSVRVRDWFPELHKLHRVEVEERREPSRIQLHEQREPSHVEVYEQREPSRVPVYEQREPNRTQVYEQRDSPNRMQVYEQRGPHEKPHNTFPGHASTIYANEMYSLNQGRGLWFPEPPGISGIPRIGDVGYFTEDGAFVRLLNVTGPEVEVTEQFPPEIDTAGFNILTVPPYLVHRRSDALHPTEYLSPSVKSSGQTIDGWASAAVAVRYRCEGKEGAILELDRPAETEWLNSTDLIRNFVLQNYKQWAPAEKLLGLPQGSLVFVTGHMRTAGDWILTAFNGRGSRFEAQGAGGVEVAGAGAAAMRTMISGFRGGLILQRASRKLWSDYMQEQPHTPQHTLFIKGYRVKEMGPIKLLRAAAGPHHIDGDWGSPGNIEGIVAEASEDDELANTDNSIAQKDPLEHLLDYILEASEATTAIGCSDDLYILLNNEWPSNLKAHLRELRPKIDVSDNNVGSISVIDALQRKRRRIGQRYMAGRGMAAGGTDEEETPGTLHDGQVALGVGPHAGSPIDWPHMVFKHKNPENGSISDATISPDGKLLAVAWDDVIVSLWTLSDGSPFHQLEESGHTDIVYTLAFSPDSTRLISGSLDCTAIIWIVGEGMAEWTLSGHDGAIVTVAYAPDGRLVVTGSDDSAVKVWSTNNGLLLHTLEGHNSAITKVVFSPSGTRLASCADADVVLWDPLSGQKVVELTSHATAIYDLAFSQDGERLVTGSEDRSSRIWDATTGTELLVLHQHTDAVLSVDFSPDSMEVVSGSYDGSIACCGSFSGLQHHVFVIQRTSPVEAVAYSKDGRFLISGYADGSIRLWDVKVGTLLAEYRGHERKVRHTGFTLCDDSIMSFTDGGTIRVCDIGNTFRLT